MYDRFSFALTAATNPIQTSYESHFITSINPVVGFVWEGLSLDILMILILVILVVMEVSQIIYYL